MAIAVTTSAELKLNQAVAMATFVSPAANEGVYVDASGADHNLRIHIKNLGATTTQTAVIKAGNGLQGVADLEVQLAPSVEKVLIVESGKYKHVTGTHKGKILIIDKVTTNTEGIGVAATVVEA